MYKLYWTRHSGALGPQILMEEAGIPHEVVPIDFRIGENKEPAYLAINPMGYIPSLESEDGEVVYETAAIMLYLAEKHELTEMAPGPADSQRGLFLRSLFFLSCTIQYLYHIYYNSQRYSTAESDCERVKQQASRNLMERWRHVDTQLAEAGPYMLGERFSLLDIYVLMMATWFVPLEDLLARYPAIERCFELTAARPAVNKILIEHGRT